MIERYQVVAGRIQAELGNLEQVVNRIERILDRTQYQADDEDFYFDAIALNLHDFYAGLERLFEQIATKIDNSLPPSSYWHRELLQQMGTPLPQLRPQVLKGDTMKMLDDYLRFRHVVRNIYTFEFDAERIERLAQRLPQTFLRTQQDLLTLPIFWKNWLRVLNIRVLDR